MAWIAAMRQTPARRRMPDANDVVADAMDCLRLTVALALRGVAILDGAVKDAASRLWSRTSLPTPSDVRALHASLTDLNRAIRALQS